MSEAADLVVRPMSCQSQRGWSGLPRVIDVCLASARLCVRRSIDICAAGPGRAGVYADRLIVWLGAVFYSADTDDRLSFMIVVYVVTMDHK